MVIRHHHQSEGTLDTLGAAYDMSKSPRVGFWPCGETCHNDEVAH